MSISSKDEEAWETSVTPTLAPYIPDLRSEESVLPLPVDLPWPVFSGSRSLWAGIAADWDQHDGTAGRPPPGFHSPARAEVSHPAYPTPGENCQEIWSFGATLNVWAEGGRWYGQCMRTGGLRIVGLEERCEATKGGCTQPESPQRAASAGLTW